MTSKTAYEECGRCKARIIHATSDNGTITLDYWPDAQGIFAAQQNELGAWRARPETPGVPVRFPEKRYAEHACGGAENASETPANVTWIQQHQKATSARKKAQRAGRGRRRAPDITGVRRAR